MDLRSKELLEKQRTELVPLSPYSKEGIRSGLKLPDGTILMNMTDVSHATLRIYANQLGAKIVTVHGSWTFTPDPETVKEYEKPRE